MRWIAQCRRLERERRGFRADILSIGVNVRVADGVRIYGSSKLFNCSIGRASYVNSARISNAEVGAFCSVGHNALIGGLGIHPTNGVSTHPAFYSVQGQSGVVFVDRQHFVEQAKVVVGNDVWVGAQAIVLDGLTIGNGAIVAAGAVVTKDVPDYAIVAGVPARIIRRRFSDDEVHTLLDVKWWQEPDGTLAELQELFRAGDVAGLAAALRQPRTAVNDKP